MDDFRLIYKILSFYKKALWKEGIPQDAITPEKMGSTEIHVKNIQLVLKNAGLIIGTNGETVITLAGLEYLEKNERMVSIASEKKPYSY